MSYHVRVDGYIEWIEKHATDKCESSFSYGQRLRKHPKQRRLRGMDKVTYLVQNNVLNLTDAKVFKALQYMIDFDSARLATPLTTKNVLLTFTSKVI